MTALATNDEGVEVSHPWPVGTLLLKQEFSGHERDLQYLQQTYDNAICMGRDAFVRAAVALRLYCEAGGDPVRLGNSGMRAMLMRIAYGQLLPELAVMYKNSSMTLTMVSALPLPVQEQLVTDEPIEIAEQAADGEWTHRKVKPSNLTPREAKLAIGDGGVRDVATQKRVMESRSEVQARSRRRAGPMHIDKKRRLLIVTEPVEITAKQLADFLRQLS